MKEEKSKGKGKARARVDAENDEDDQQNGAGDQDAEGDDDEGDREGVGSPRGAKRTRLNEEGESRPGGSGSQRIPRQKTLPRDVDG